MVSSVVAAGIEARVWEALHSVQDPEYPLSIADMGMIYGVDIDEATARITMTFTSIGCPAMDMILEDLRVAASAVAGIDDVTFEVVWDPPWTANRISPAGRRILQLHGVVG